MGAGRGFLVMGLAALLWLPGCAEPLVPDPILVEKTITLQLRFKDSCGSGFVCSYDASCMGAVQLIAKRVSDKSVIGSSCTPLGEDGLSPRLGVLCDIIFSEVVAELPDLPLDDDFFLQVRGLHDADGAESACANTSTSKWLMWGETDPISVMNLPDRVTAEASVECRVCENGCMGLGSSCSLEMPTSNCLPSLSCNKRCDPTAENSCFDGQLVCDAETASCAVPNDEITFCSTCNSRADCPNNHHCIADIGSSTGRCAPTCPTEMCPSGAFCQPIGEGTLLQELP